MKYNNKIMYRKRKIRRNTYGNQIDITHLKKMFITCFLKICICIFIVTALAVWKDINVGKCPVYRICEYIEDNSFTDKITLYIASLFE